MKKMVFRLILLKKIEFKKRYMYKQAKNFGFRDSRVVSCSQDLDELLNKYQGFSKEGNCNERYISD